MAKLQVLICTIDNGIDKIAKLIPSPSDNISYLISWQQSNPTCNITTPSELLREDINIITLNQLGLSRNRNNALKHATGDICLIADDDIKLYPLGLEQIITTFNQHPDLDLAAFRFHSDSFPKIYPEQSFDLANEPKFYYTSSIEIAFRRNRILEKGVGFNELFGIGAPVLNSGEEGIFIVDALRSNLTCLFFPITIAEHNQATTGIGEPTPQILMSKGAYIYYRYTSHYHIRILRVALGIALRQKINLCYILKYLLNGANYMKKNG
ncbi:MAG: glycosyltransferase family 2 protein [Bacteroidales bacterium]